MIWTYMDVHGRPYLRLRHQNASNYGCQSHCLTEERLHPRFRQLAVIWQGRFCAYPDDRDHLFRTLPVLVTSPSAGSGSCVFFSTLRSCVRFIGACVSPPSVTAFNAHANDQECSPSIAFSGLLSASDRLSVPAASNCARRPARSCAQHP